MSHYQPSMVSDAASPTLPANLPALPLRNKVAFPFVVMPISVGAPRSIKMTEEALQSHQAVALLTTKNPSVTDPVPGQISEIGTAARIH